MSAAGARHAYEVNRARIASLWAEARPVSADDAAGRYLARSGAAQGTWPAALRLHPALAPIKTKQSSQENSHVRWDDSSDGGNGSLLCV